MSASLDDVLSALQQLNDTNRRIADALERGATAQPPGPVTSWAAVADAAGVSVATLLRRRKDRGDKSEPYFADVEAARAWYAALIGPEEPKRRRQAPKAYKPQSQATEADVRAALASLRH